MILSNLFLRDRREAIKPRPNWEGAGKVHDWRNYVTDDLRRYWHRMSPRIRLVVADSLAAQANAEHWE